MKNLASNFTAIILSLLLFVNCTDKKTGDNEMLQSKIGQFAPTEIKYDKSLLDGNQKVVLHKLHQAAKIIDELFLEQVYDKNYQIKELLASSNDERDRLILDYFNIMFGPFDRLDHDKPFYGNETKPLGANFYPSDMSKAEFESWIKNHPENANEFTSEFTVIKRNGNELKAVPYSEYYKDKLFRISDLLREAAAYADNKSLKKYLETRASAFESNNYYESDMAWMDLKDHEIEVIIGPYEVYEDNLFNYKASFECFLTIVDPAETNKLKKYASYLDQMEKNLPIEEKYKNFERGKESPIVVVQEVFSAGDSKAGVQTLAFNLPNDERVRIAKGSKKVMLKNIHEAKFEKLLKPISEIVLDPAQLQYVTFDGFFNHTLMHEMSHGLGPGFITVNGRKTEVKKELKETYSKIEECKADILGMLNNMFMIEHGEAPKSFSEEIWTTFLAGVFRSVRFGINEAHGAGTAIIYNFMLENGGYEFDAAAHKVKVNYGNAYYIMKLLANKLLTIQATGDYEGAKALIEKYGTESPSIKLMREKLTALPVDIKPVFEIDSDY